MAISKEDVIKVADLARLNLTDSEVTEYTDQLQKILKHVEDLEKVDTKGVEPTSFTVPLRQVFRKDEIRESLSPEEALKNAPSKVGTAFKVPKIISDS